MEKRVPQYPLFQVRLLISQRRVRTTKSASLGIGALGLNIETMLSIITNLTPLDFYKSMTTHNDHRVWQDVYRPSTSAGKLYIKLTILDELLVVSFKEL